MSRSSVSGRGEGRRGPAGVAAPAGILLLLLLLSSAAAHAMGSLPTGPSERGTETEVGGGTVMSDMLPAQVRLLTDREFQTVLEREIAAARSEVVLAVYHFDVSGDGSERAMSLGETLAAAAARGVNVIVILEIGREASPVTRDNRSTAAYLGKRGVKVYADMSGTTVHSKLAVIDRRLAFIGSHDLEQQSLGVYREATLAVDSVVLARELLHFIESFDPVPLGPAP